MPQLHVPEPDKLLERLRRIYLKAEQDIIAAIAYKRSRGLVDYGNVAALMRVQEILKRMVDDTWKYAPAMIEKEFYVAHPEARAFPEPVAKHQAGYSNAFVLTSTQTAIVDRLVMNLTGTIAETAETVKRTLSEALLGRVSDDIYRKAGLEAAALSTATGSGAWERGRDLADRLRRQGVTGFVDKAGRSWSLSNYANMAARTTKRQAAILAVITADEGQDLYVISSHGTTCPVCAPLEGRVYSKSGRNPNYPPLSAAFGKIDKTGPNTLENSYLNIHPNCLHSISRYNLDGKSPEEVERDRRFSSFTENPPTVDPRSQEQIEAYRKKEAARRRLVEAYHQYDRYRAALGNKMPKTIETFLKHKRAGDATYRGWVALYRSTARAVK